MLNGIGNEGCRMNSLVKRSVLVMLLIALQCGISSSQTHRWVLPVADGGGDAPSPPSVHGYLADVKKRIITVKKDSRKGTPQELVKFQLAPKTDFFTADGGPYESDRLRVGQYVWVWYATANPAQAGNPPRAAVVVLWSLDPDDQPSAKVRWSYDRK
jgi:hypothetical protein